MAANLLIASRSIRKLESTEDGKARLSGNLDDIPTLGEAKAAGAGAGTSPDGRGANDDVTRAIEESLQSSKQGPKRAKRDQRHKLKEAANL